MKNIAPSILLIASSSVIAGTDFNCLNSCTASGNSYIQCNSRCTSTPRNTMPSLNELQGMINSTGNVDFVGAYNRGVNAGLEQRARRAQIQEIEENTKLIKEQQMLFQEQRLQLENTRELKNERAYINKTTAPNKSFATQNHSTSDDQSNNYGRTVEWKTNKPKVEQKFVTNKSMRSGPEVQTFENCMQLTDRHDFPIKSMSNLKEQAIKGDIVSQYKLGLGYLFGLGGEDKNDEFALYWISRAANRLHPSSLNMLGLAYLHGFGSLKPNKHEAARLFKISSEMGELDAAVNLAQILIDESQDSTNYAEGLRILRLASSSGNSYGQAILGYHHLTGSIGVEKNEYEAVRLFLLSSQANNNIGQLYLANSYINGLGGLPVDREKARGLLMQSINNGNTQAHTELKKLLEHLEPETKFVKFNSRFENESCSFDHDCARALICKYGKCSQ